MLKFNLFRSIHSQNVRIQKNNKVFMAMFLAIFASSSLSAAEQDFSEAYIEDSTATVSNDEHGTMFIQGVNNEYHAGLIQGNGKVGKETRKINKFSKVDIRGSKNVTINRSDKLECTVKADKNIIPIIITKVKRGTLFITSKSGVSYSSMNKIEVTCSGPNLTAANVRGASSIRAKNVEEKDFKLEVQGSSKANLNLKVDQLKAQVQGSSRLKLTGKAKNINVKASGASKVNLVQLTAVKGKLFASGVSQIKHSRNGNFEANTSGLGRINSARISGKKGKVKTKKTKCKTRLGYE